MSDLRRSHTVNTVDSERTLYEDGPHHHAAASPQAKTSDGTSDGSPLSKDDRSSYAYFTTNNVPDRSFADAVALLRGDDAAGMTARDARTSPDSPSSSSASPAPARSRDWSAALAVLSGTYGVGGAAPRVPDPARNAATTQDGEGEGKRKESKWKTFVNRGASANAS